MADVGIYEGISTIIIQIIISNWNQPLVLVITYTALHAVYKLNIIHMHNILQTVEC